MTVFLSQKWMEKQVTSLFYSAVWGRGRREVGARTRVHFVCMWAYFVQNTLDQIRDSIAGFLEPQDLEVHGNCILLGERASIKEIQHLSKMSPAIPCLWLPTALTMGVCGFETKYDFKNRCKSRNDLITVQVIWHENWCCGVSSAKMQISRWVHSCACIRICFWGNLVWCLVMLFCNTQA